MKNHVRAHRDEAGLSQADLAAAVGVTRQTINAIELRKYVPSTLLALRLSAIFERSVNELFELEAGDWD